MSNGRTSITVIGAGIVGTTLALQLQRDGFAVTLLDAAGVGQGCSYGNAGGISPGAIVPAATPALLSAVPRWLLERDGPLSLRWRHLPRVLPWLLRWVAQGKAARVRHNSAALAALNRDAFAGYQALLDPAQYSDLIRQTGQLVLWRTPVPADSLAQELRAHAGITLQAIGPGELAEIEPALSTDYRKAVLFPGNGFTVNPERLVTALADNFTAAGGQLLRRRVVDFELGEHGPRALYTDCGSMPVQRIVIAAGAWSARLAARLGVQIPLEPERGYHATFPGLQSGLKIPALDAERRIMVTQMEFGLRVAGTAEFAGLDAAPDYRRAALLARQARQVFRQLPATGPVSSWMGMRPSLPDSIPVIDRHPAFADVYFAFGHGHLGLSGAPMTARLVAELIAGQPTSIDAAPYRQQRFARGVR